MTVPRHPIELRAIDSHTGGEPTRLIVDGFPDPGTAAWRSAANASPANSIAGARRLSRSRAATMCWWGAAVQTGLTAGNRRGDFLQQRRLSEHVGMAPSGLSPAGMAWSHQAGHPPD